MKLLTQLALCICIIISISACSNQGNGTTITDQKTPVKPEKVEVTESMLVIENNMDNMDRGNHEYDSTVVGGIVVDPNYYVSQSISRGDVIYFKTPQFKNDKNPNMKPAEYNLSRVIGLPGEKLTIKTGQIYVDGKRLETFYGKAQSKGQDKETYQTNGDNASNKEFMENYFDTNMEEITVPENHIFVLGDTWWRSIDSQLFGPLQVTAVQGKVLGYEK